MSLPATPSRSTDMSELLGAIASSLTSQSAQPVYVKNRQHQWIYVNTAAAELVGLNAEAIVGRSEADFFYPSRLPSSSEIKTSCFSQVSRSAACL